MAKVHLFLKRGLHDLCFAIKSGSFTKPCNLTTDQRKDRGKYRYFFSLICLDIALCFEMMKNLYESLRLKKLNVDTYILIKNFFRRRTSIF